MPTTAVGASQTRPAKEWRRPTAGLPTNTVSVAPQPAGLIGHPSPTVSSPPPPSRRPPHRPMSASRCHRCCHAVHGVLLLLTPLMASRRVALSPPPPRAAAVYDLPPCIVLAPSTRHHLHRLPHNQIRAGAPDLDARGLDPVGAEPDPPPPVGEGVIILHPKLCSSSPHRKWSDAEAWPRGRHPRLSPGSPGGYSGCGETEVRCVWWGEARVRPKPPARGRRGAKSVKSRYTIQMFNENFVNKAETRSVWMPRRVDC